jgi:predicted component of viral defense system (DUF524 family)
VSDCTTYIFEKENYGSLELACSDTNRNYYQSVSIDKIPFRVRGLLNFKNYRPFSFFEWQKIQYSYVIEDSTALSFPLELRINNRTLNHSKLRGNTHLLSGQFSFEDQVGETKIEIIDNANKLLVEISTEVFPQKMDYKSDYKAMMAEISEIIQNLAYDSLKDTFRKSRARLTGQATENEWWNILDALFEQLVSNLGVIKRLPKHEIVNKEKVLPIEKVRSVSKNSINWFIKNAPYSNHNNHGIKVNDDTYFTHALSNKKVITYDTYENRFIVWAVKNIIEQLKQYKKHIENTLKTNNFSSLTKRMKMYQSLLQGIINENPFNEISEFEKRKHFSTSLTMGAGYRDFMHIYLLLTRGLEIADNDIFKIELKNISTLYEYWCFLKLVRILKEENNSKIDYQDLIKVSAGKIKVDLIKGNRSKVKFRKDNSQETTTIYFNQEFKKDDKRIFTYNQRPDYSIKFKKNGFDKPFWYIFDAKYRFNEDKSIENNNYDVPQDAIGQLHRYRDAILHTEPTNSTYRNAIKNLGGIILYPYPLSEKEFTNNTYYKSIEQVNIGALPFLPSKSGLVSDLLNELINKRLPEEHFEQFIEMDNSEYENKRNKWSEWVAIGVIQKEQQTERLNFLKDKQIFHFPFVKNMESRLYLSKRIMVCISGLNDAILYDIENWEIMTNSELRTLCTTWNHKYEKYLAFHLKNELQITLKDRLTPIRLRYVNSQGLDLYLNNKESNISYLFFTNHDASILFNELNNKNYDFEVKINNKDTNITEFNLPNFKIYSSNKYPNLHYKINDQFVPIKELFDILERFKD